MATLLTPLLLGQWQSAPRLRAIVTDVIQPMFDNGVEAVDQIAAMLDPDTAEGVWLDYLAARIGLARPAMSNPAQDPRFGFDSAGQPFDQASFQGVAANDAVFPLPDAIFRKFIAARAIAMTADGTFPPLRRAVLAVDPAATVVDNRNMTITITTSEQALVKLADSSGVLPRAGGVGLVYA